MSDQFLYEFQKQPPVAFKNRLYAQISSGQSHRTKMLPALMYGLAGIVLGLGLLLALSSPARVYAQEIIYSIGQWIISHQPTAAEQFEDKLQSGEIDADNIKNSDIVEWQAPIWISADEAEMLTGFQVYQLQLEELDAAPVYREVQTGENENNGLSVITVYKLHEGNLVFRQTKNDFGSGPIELPVGKAEVNRVEIAASDGYWIEGIRLSTYVNGENKVEPKYANILVWEKEGFEFWLQSSPGLPLENMLQMAQQIY